MGEGGVVFEYAWLGECLSTGLGASGDHVVLLPDLDSLDHPHTPLPSPPFPLHTNNLNTNSKDFFYFFFPTARAGMGCSPPHIALLSGLQGTGMTGRQITDVLHRLAMQFGPVQGRLLPRCK